MCVRFMCTNGERKTISVCDCHDLGTVAPRSLSHSSAPFFADTKLPSRRSLIGQSFLFVLSPAPTEPGFLPILPASPIPEICDDKLLRWIPTRHIIPGCASTANTKNTIQYLLVIYCVTVNSITQGLFFPILNSKNFLSIIHTNHTFGITSIQSSYLISSRAFLNPKV